jgi:putative Holliday junction resolvase
VTESLSPPGGLFPPTGRLLGVDYGTHRVGLAVSDVERRIASPLGTYHRQSPAQDGQHFRAVVAAERVVGLVVGLPVHMSGEEGAKAKEAREFGAWLARLTGLPVLYWDERLTTAEARQFLAGSGLSARKRKERLDRVAAQILLQSYLDAGCPGPDAPGPLTGE